MEFEAKDVEKLLIELDSMANISKFVACSIPDKSLMSCIPNGYPNI